MGQYNDSGSAWFTAQQACYDFLCREMGAVDGKTAWLGDRLPNNMANCWCFLISGGPEQIQNYQVPTPAMHYLADAAMIGQYLNLKDAMNMGMLVNNKLPAYFKKDPAINPMSRRGIEPNVEVFEVTTHPELASMMVENEQGKQVTLWVCVIRFRVVYNNNYVKEGSKINE